MTTIFEKCICGDSIVVRVDFRPEPTGLVTPVAPKVAMSEWWARHRSHRVEQVAS